MECKYCGNTDCKAFYIEERGSQKALVCDRCGRWIKWVGKNEMRALLAQGVHFHDIKKVNKNEYNNVHCVKKAQDSVLKCQECGGTKFEKRQVSIHIGLYCTQCGRWLKWVKKGSEVVG